MDIKRYLQSHPDDVQRIAELAGTKPVYLRQIAGGHRRPSHKLAQAIQRATAGAVTVHDLRPDIYGDRPASAA